MRIRLARHLKAACATNTIATTTPFFVLRTDFSVAKHERDHEFIFPDSRHIAPPRTVETVVHDDAVTLATKCQALLHYDLSQTARLPKRTLISERKR